jgi:hypothetical protein
VLNVTRTALALLVIGLTAHVAAAQSTFDVNPSKAEDLETTWPPLEHETRVERPHGRPVIGRRPSGRSGARFVLISPLRILSERAVKQLANDRVLPTNY